VGRRHPSHCASTDKPTTFGKANLTLRTLSASLVNTPIAASVEKLTQQAENEADFARDWRHRWLAHLDLQLALDNTAHRLKDSSRMSIRAALSSIASVLNEVSGHFFDSEINFSVGSKAGGASDLVRILEEYSHRNS
jgi:hypothetical protein